MIHYGRECPMGDPADGCDYDEEWPELDEWETDLEPHPVHLFPSPPDETEAAMRAADELVESLEQPEPSPEPADYTPAPPTMAETWPPAERAELARRLERLGTTIPELSDARELLGLPRLSASSTQARALAHHLLAGKRGKAAISAVREERAKLVARLAHPELVNAVVIARKERGLRANSATWRLGELRAVALRAVEILLEDEGRAA